MNTCIYCKAPTEEESFCSKECEEKYNKSLENAVYKECPAIKTKQLTQKEINMQNDFLKKTKGK